MVAAVSVLTAALKNFKPTAAVIAGGGASILTLAIGSVLVSIGFVIPFINIPITMAMVATAAPAIGHIVSAYVPDTLNQQINALAVTLNKDAESIRSFIPQFEDTYPADKVTNVAQGDR